MRTLAASVCIAAKAAEVAGLDHQAARKSKDWSAAMTRRFDAIIIGAGQAGPSLADRLTRAGMSVAIIERKLFGGTCVNTGCTPTKTLVASAYAAHLARRHGACEGAGRHRLRQFARRCREMAAWHARLYGHSRPRQLRGPRHNPGWRRAPNRTADLHQRRRPRRRA